MLLPAILIKALIVMSVLLPNKRLPFHLSVSSSFSCFDIIHANIWGPYSTPSLNGLNIFLPLWMIIVDVLRST